MKKSAKKRRKENLDFYGWKGNPEGNYHKVWGS